MRYSLLALAVVVVLALSSVARAQDDPGPPFNHLSADWAKALESKDIVGMMAMYAHDAELLSPDGTHALGVAEIGRLFQGVFGKFDASITMTSRGTGWSGAYAYDSGSYQETLADRATHSSHKYRGDYLTLYDCASPGHCLIIQQVWTGQTPALP